MRNSRMLSSISQQDLSDLFRIVEKVSKIQKLGCRIPSELFDFLNVMEHGLKHGANNWLTPDGNTADHKSNHNSMFHHLASSFADSSLPRSVDAGSGLDHLLHLACRALMGYTRMQLGIVHEKDLK